VEPEEEPELLLPHAVTMSVSGSVRTRLSFMVSIGRRHWVATRPPPQRDTWLEKNGFEVSATGSLSVHQNRS
jgi:hypothetical protein